MADQSANKNPEKLGSAFRNSATAPIQQITGPSRNISLREQAPAEPRGEHNLQFSKKLLLIVLSRPRLGSTNKQS